MRLRLAFFSLLCLLPALATAAELWTGTADVKFRGYSTLHDFEGTANRVPLRVTVDDGARGRVVSATSSVEVKDMSTDHEGRDKKMWEMFRQTTYRLIKVEVENANEATLRPAGGGPGAMPVKLTMAGTTGLVTAKVTNIVESPTRGSFDLAFPVSLKAFKLAPPKLLGGLVSVRDTVDVTVRVVLTKGAAR